MQATTVQRAVQSRLQLCLARPDGSGAGGRMPTQECRTLGMAGTAGGGGTAGTAGPSDNRRVWHLRLKSVTCTPGVVGVGGLGAAQGGAAGEHAHSGCSAVACRAQHSKSTTTSELPKPHNPRPPLTLTLQCLSTNRFGLLRSCTTSRGTQTLAHQAVRWRTDRQACRRAGRSFSAWWHSLNVRSHDWQAVALQLC